MIRLFTILLLVSAGFPRLGAGSAGCQDLCGESGCHPPVVQSACCGRDSEDEGFCPMSNGPCECFAAPPPDPSPKPDVPLPRSERDTATDMPNGRPRVTPVLEPASDTPRVASLVLGLTAGKSHNEVQALLGIWRT